MAGPTPDELREQAVTEARKAVTSARRTEEVAQAVAVQSGDPADKAVAEAASKLVESLDNLFNEMSKEENR